MIGNLQAERDVIGRLRIRCDETQRSAAPTTLAGLFGPLRLHPPALPARAILCIRQLPDPRPGCLSISQRRIRPPQDWEQAMQAAIEGLMHRACRPRHGPVAPSALAVIFDDPAEMLACLALDWLDGTLSANWWWRELLKGSSPE